MTVPRLPSRVVLNAAWAIYNFLLEANANATIDPDKRPEFEHHEIRDVLRIDKRIYSQAHTLARRLAHRKGDNICFNYINDEGRSVFCLNPIGDQLNRSTLTRGRAKHGGDMNYLHQLEYGASSPNTSPADRAMYEVMARVTFNMNDTQDAMVELFGQKLVDPAGLCGEAAPPDA